jgi:hypothetical protein
VNDHDIEHIARVDRKGLGTYTDGSRTLIIRLTEGMLRLELWDGRGASYSIEPYRPSTSKDWPYSLFPLADIVTTTIGASSSEAAAKDNRVRESLMSLLLLQGVSQVINAFVWKHPGSKAQQRFEKSTRCWLLDVPLELLNRVTDFVLTTDTHLKGTVDLHEEKERFVFAKSMVVPDGSAMEGKRWGGDPRNLPQRFNRVQYTCRLFWEQYRVVDRAYFYVQQVTAMLKNSTGKLVQELRNSLRVEGALVGLIQDAAVHSKQGLEVLRKKTGVGACFELIKHMFTNSI